MTELTFQFQVSGPKADKTAKALTELLADAFGETPRIQKLESRTTGEAGEEKGVEIWAIMAVILALPGAIHNLEKLAERHEFKQKLKKLIAWDRERRATDPETYIDLLLPGRLARRLEGLDEADLLNDISEVLKNENVS